MLGLFHVDEVYDDDASHISEAQLSGNFFCCNQVGFQCSSFLVTFLIRLVPTIDVDDVKGLGMFYDKITALWETDSLTKQAFDLLLDSKTFKELRFTLVKLNDFFLFRGNGSDVRPDLIIDQFILYGDCVE